LIVVIIVVIKAKITGALCKSQMSDMMQESVVE